MTRKVFFSVTAFLLVLLIPFASAAQMPWSWGHNGSGMLGNGTQTGSTVPVQVSGLTDLKGISAGYAHSMALSNDGTVWVWGADNYGQLGDGTYGNGIISAVPIQVAGLSGVKTVLAGGYSSYVIKEDGTVWAWGGNGWGCLGTGSSDGKITNPTKVSNLSDITAIAAGVEFSLALKNDGSVWASGRNTDGQLGIGPTTDHSDVPVQIPGLSSVVAIAAGESYGLALKSDGTVWAWGNNRYGQVGNGTTDNAAVPVQVLDLAGATAIAAGRNHSIAMKNDGTLWAWGWNGNGQLGDGTSVDAKLPVQVTGITDIRTFAGASYNTYAILNNGEVWAWGWGDGGRLGNGTETSSHVPVRVMYLEGATAVSGGYEHALAIASCLTSCTATVPETGMTTIEVPFSASADASHCGDTPAAYSWSFGDGAQSSEQNPVHTYTEAGSFDWTMTASAEGQSCQEAGTIIISECDPPLNLSLKKATSPFRIIVTGSNMDKEIRVYINDSLWTGVVWKSSGKIVLKSGSALKAAVPKGAETTFKFVNYNGCSTVLTWKY